MAKVYKKCLAMSSRIKRKKNFAKGSEKKNKRNIEEILIRQEILELTCRSKGIIHLNIGRMI